MRVRQNNPAGNGNLIVYTVLVNGVATALAVSMASTALDGANLVSTAVVVAGDLLALRVTKAVQVGASPINDIVTLELA
jgi:predicted transcriptional regulator